MLTLIKKQQEEQYDSKQNLCLLFNYFREREKQSKNPIERYDCQYIADQASWNGNLEILLGKMGSTFSGKRSGVAKNESYFSIHTANIDQRMAEFKVDSISEFAKAIHELKLTDCFFRVPAPPVASQVINATVAEYNKRIQAAKTPDEKFTAITDFVWQLEHDHVFTDANLRVCILLLNRLLLQHGFGLATLDNPNLVDTYGKTEWAAEVRKGIDNTKKLIIHKNNLGFDTNSISVDARKLFREWSRNLPALIMKSSLTIHYRTLKTAQDKIQMFRKVIEQSEWEMGRSPWAGKAIVIDGKEKRVPNGMYYQWLEIQKAEKDNKWNECLNKILKLGVDSANNPPVFASRDPRAQAYYEFMRDQSAVKVTENEKAFQAASLAFLKMR
jgi:prophage maintenance system killer protein